MDRDALILSLETDVRTCAFRFKRTVPRWITLEELISAGWTGAIEAVDRWEPERSKLRSYAPNLIRGRILDYLRDLDEMPRLKRIRYRQDLAAYILGNCMGEKPKGLFFVELGMAYKWEDVGSPRMYRRIEGKIDLAKILRRANLTSRELVILRRTLLEQKTLKSTGELFGINESRTCQIRAAALKKLRAAA